MDSFLFPTNYSAYARCQAISILETEDFSSSKNIKSKLPTTIPTEETHKNPLHLVSFLLFPHPHMDKAICFFFSKVSYSKWEWDTSSEQSASTEFNGISFRTSPGKKRM